MAKSKRKSISKKVRFEVFKRDSFTCQYCSRSAPDVILHCDHIKPVAKGGNNGILNLVTACSDCNLGKGPIPLDDFSTVEKQRRQLEELQAKREQIDLMIKWKEGLSDIEETGSASLIKYFQELFSGQTLTFKGERDMAARLRKHGYKEVRRVIEIVADQYLEFDNENKVVTKDSAIIALNKIDPILRNRKRYRNPDDSGLEFYASTVLESKRYLSRSAKQYIHEVAKSAYDKGVDAEAIRGAARNSRDECTFHDSIAELLEEINE